MIPKVEDCILQSEDYTKKLVVFEIKNYNKHRHRHRELEMHSFCPLRIIRAIKEPTFTIKSKQKKSFCYYLEEFSLNGVMRYTKVVVFCKKKFRSIATAFRTDHIQELQYGYKKVFYNSL